MSKQNIEQIISETLTGDVQWSALELASSLLANGVSCVRDTTTEYWKDKTYFVCNYNGQSVCYVSINEFEPNTWNIQGDDSGDAWYEDVPLDDTIKEIAWRNVAVCNHYDVCGACGSPEVATRKRIFGKEFEHVCPITIKFDNPDASEVECMKAVFGARVNHIKNTVV